MRLKELTPPHARVFPVNHRFLAAVVQIMAVVVVARDAVASNTDAAHLRAPSS